MRSSWRDPPPQDVIRTDEFSCGGYYWRLVIFPKGDRGSKQYTEGHTSVYLQVQSLVSTRTDPCRGASL